MKEVDSKMNDELKSEWADLVTIKNKFIIFPTEKSFSLKKNKNIAKTIQNKQL